MNKIVTCILAGGIATGIAAAQTPKHDEKLSDVETLKLQVAQKDLVINQLQQQILQLSAEVLQEKSQEANSKMTAAKSEVTQVHKGMVVQFKPDGEPYLLDNPLTAPEMKK
jgi:outer membrane murein-binding lipoprotein Lpp